MSRRAGAVVLAALLLVSANAGVGAAGGGAPVAAFGIRPQNSTDPSVDRGHFWFHLATGGSATEAIVLHNTTTEPLTFTVYGADMLQAAGGGLAPAQQTDTMFDVGAWMKVESTSLTVAPGADGVDHFTVTIPEGAAPGDHVGAIVAAANVGVQKGVSVQARGALITQVTIPGVAHPSAQLSALVAHPAGDGRDSFSIVMTNDGNLLLTFSGSLQITDSDGHVLGALPMSPSGADLIPGASVQLQSDQWTFAKGTSVVTAQIALQADHKPFQTASSAPLTFSFTDWVRIIVELVVAVMVLGIVGFVVWRLRRRTMAARARQRQVAMDEELRDQVTGRLRDLDR